MKNLVILGAGGFAREASQLVEEINCSNINPEKWNLIGFIDEDETKWGSMLRGYPVLGGWEAFAELSPEVSVICVVGEPVSKMRMVKHARELGRHFVTLIHPSVSPTEDLSIGKGVLINKGCLLTTAIIIGDHVSVNPGCGIGHDAVIGDFTTLMWRVNISGAVEVGEGCLIGSGATVLQEKRIGSWSSVGAGAVVTADIPANCTAVGVPARIVKG